MPIPLWKCMHCKTIFDSHQESIDCENHHLKIQSAQVNQYMKNSGYPLFVEITFTNGEKEIYMREKDAWYK